MNGFNCRIPCHWFACHWIRIVSIVFWLVLQRTPLNSNNSGRVFSSYSHSTLFHCLSFFQENGILQGNWYNGFWDRAWTTSKRSVAAQRAIGKTLITATIICLLQCLDQTATTAIFWYRASIARDKLVKIHSIANRIAVDSLKDPSMARKDMRQLPSTHRACSLWRHPLLFFLFVVFGNSPKKMCFASKFVDKYDR